jgi:hypothetical protein
MLETAAIARAAASTFPINRLALEIIAEIFWNCLVHGQETVWMSSGNAPLLLCRVCSSWRTLALGIPQLWAHVGIRIRHHDGVDPSICTHITNAWLERSGTLPLTVTIDNWGYCAPTTIFLDAVLSAVCSHSPRWQNLTVTSWGPLSFPRLEILPLLRAFQIQVFTNPEQNTISLPFSGSPRLTRLTWQYPLDAPIDPRIPWSQMSHLRLTSQMPFFAALETIRLCPQLEIFTANLTAESIRDHHPTTVTNCHLRTLELGITGHADYSPFFNSLILPKLGEFTLSGTRSNAASVRGAFLDFLTRSNCKLYKLELRHCAFEPFIECLERESFKSIQELGIKSRPAFTDDELIRLTEFPSPPAPPVLLPKLTYLKLRWCLQASRGMLAKMVVSRRRQRDGREAEPLQYLGVTTEELYKEEVVSIKDEVKDGFQAVIRPHYILNESGEREEEG